MHDARSLLPKIDELRHRALKENYDVIIVNETWMDNNISSSLINISEIGRASCRERV